MTVQLALRKRDTRIAARVIQWWTGSIYSHCELVIDGWCYSSSAMDGGVRRKRIDLDPEKWDVAPLPWADDQRALDYFTATDHHRYGWTGLVLSQLLNLNRSTDKAQFCSQWRAAALGLPSPASYSPATLGAICGFVGSLLAA
ncbi:hypothetical protein [Stutzerimonas stutzeri]|uniref:hypothetical protein n=1 Tax=Stutzerimonas stutzeri TaxID=316 RepID=UPI002447768E|nr:hypothetical protein [Stutzerimonas stutzeri]MDH0156482.1 hypothetical protein [Stutzerimonas stutzeri]